MAWQILITAAGSAIFTLVLAIVAYYWLMLPALERRLSAAAQEIEARVQNGVEAAGENMLPAFRAEVREGFLEALAQWPSNELRNVTRTGAGFVEEGLNNLFGRRKKD